jgi:hypothetical protein
LLAAAAPGAGGFILWLVIPAKAGIQPLLLTPEKLDSSFALE